MFVRSVHVDLCVVGELSLLHVPPPLEALHNKVRNGKSQSLKSTPLLSSLSFSLSLSEDL